MMRRRMIVAMGTTPTLLPDGAQSAYLRFPRVAPLVARTLGVMVALWTHVHNVHLLTTAIP